MFSNYTSHVQKKNMGTTPPHAQISSPPSLLQPVSWIQESPIEHWRSHRRLQNTTRLYSHELRWRHLVRFFPPRSSDVVLRGGWFLNDFWCLGLGDSDCFGRKLRATISRWPAAPMRCPRWKERISPCCNVLSQQIWKTQETKSWKPSDSLNYVWKTWSQDGSPFKVHVLSFGTVKSASSAGSIRSCR